VKNERGECEATGGLSMLLLLFCESKLLSTPIAGMGKAIKALETVPPTPRKTTLFKNIQYFSFWH